MVVTPVQAAKKKGSGELGPLDCQLQERLDLETGELKPALVCPGGQTTTVRYRATSSPGWYYRMAGDKCVDCPLFSPCRDKVSNDKQPRNWFISDYREPVLAAWGYVETAAFRVEGSVQSGVTGSKVKPPLRCRHKWVKIAGSLWSKWVISARTNSPQPGSFWCQ